MPDLQNKNENLIWWAEQMMERAEALALLIEWDENGMPKKNRELEKLLATANEVYAALGIILRRGMGEITQKKAMELGWKLGMMEKYMTDAGVMIAGV